MSDPAQHPVVMFLRAAVTAATGIFGLQWAVVFAETGDTLLSYGTGVAALLTFSTLLVRHIMATGAQWKEIVTALREEMERKDKEHASERAHERRKTKDALKLLEERVQRAEHEREQARFRAGDRDDPGPFSSRGSRFDDNDSET